MATRSKDITFIIPGQAQPAGAAVTRGRGAGSVKASVRVGVQRDAGAPVRVTARPGEDVVVLTIANGPTLVLHPEDARDLLRAQSAGATRSAGGGGDADEISVAVQLGWPGIEAGATRAATRGWTGQAVLSAFEVLTGLFKDPAVTIATAAVTRKLDGAVDEGVYRLSAESMPDSLKGSGTKLDNVPAAADGGPLLVLIHGTFVDTTRTFRKLWALHPEVVRTLFSHYGQRVYGFDHPTLGASPISNALALVKALPAGARLHLLTHSRGGLVAEVLARACGGGALSAAELAAFADPKYAQQRTDLIALVKLAQSKGLKVERVVRVACPARGTLLASKRLDAYLSVLQWGLQLAGLPVVPELVDFLHEVARRRADPRQLPGLEAMMPDSAVVNWLNVADETIPGELRVIAGDMQGDSVISWVKTLLTDAFYWTDNDIVVQTRSMYGGAPRSGNGPGPSASFVLDRGANVSHFNYFANDSTVTAITDALTAEAPAGFAAIGPLSWAGKDVSGSRGAKAVARSRGGPGEKPGERPAVIVLPGILGSNLKLDGKRIWLGFRFVNSLTKLAWDPATAARVEPDGPIGLSYDDLIDRLADTHEVIPFAYDWRRPIEDEARRLAERVEVELEARAASQQPVRLIAHSMGGLVARTMQLERPETWKRMMARDGARLLMLGTPNGGSWAPMQTLSGDDTFGNTLVAFGSLFDNGGARKMMAGMPGFIQLQAALLDPAQGLDKASTWAQLAHDDIQALLDRSLWHDEGAQRTIYEWSAPPQAVLDQAVSLRRRLDAQAAALGADAQKMLLVVGRSPFTPNGIVMGAEGLEYVNVADEGDGRVPLRSALLPGVRTWKVDAEHGKLPDVAGAFNAYVELLQTGQTEQLKALEASPRARGAGGSRAAPPVTVRSRPSRGLGDATPPAFEADIWATPPVAPGFATQQLASGRVDVLDVVVLNGDLKFIRQPLMLGHYRSTTLTGTEWVVDQLLHRNMSEALAAGLYADLPGSYQIFRNERRSFENPLEMPRPGAAIVVGLGEEGGLRETELVDTVRQAVLAYARQLAEAPGARAETFELAATLIGSGGTRITAGAAARRIVEGALQANLRLRAIRWPELRRLTFVELYLDRASEAWRALALQQQEVPSFRVASRIAAGPGAKRRPLESSYRSTPYDFISALTDDGDPKRPTITFTLDTKRARTEVHAQRAQATLLRSLVRAASNDASHDLLIRRTLFNLLVPVEMETFLAGSGELVMELDSGTASIPWELIDTRHAPAAPGEGDDDGDDGDNAPTAGALAIDDDKDLPWAIRCRLIRKLQLRDFRGPVLDARTEDRALVIGEPKCDPPYQRLPGAQREAQAVAELLSTSGLHNRVRALTEQNDAQTIINALYESPYRIVHIAGHGKERDDGLDGDDGGVVLSGKSTYLGANEVRAMRTVPELVFLNCCHLAARDADSTLSGRYDRAAFAANIAEELIRVGVRCVIAAGWAVDDKAAAVFATTFYRALLVDKSRFIDAVYQARKKAYEVDPRGNTWAAYQCYGDAEWSWNPPVTRRGTASPRVNPFDIIASPVALTLALENLATDIRYRTDRTPGELRGALAEVRELETRFADAWGGMGAVAESFGLAYAEVGEGDKAIAWYRVAVQADDGSASFKAAEQLGNQLARSAEREADPVRARTAIADAITLLGGVVGLRPSVESASLLGSAYKRLAQIEGRAGNRVQETRALQSMIRHYATAEQTARAARADNLFYPAKNALGAELRLAFLEGRDPAIDPERLNQVQVSLERASQTSPDFWAYVGLVEVRVLQALAQRRLNEAAAALIDAFRALKVRVPAQVMWRSVYNEAQFTVGAYAGVASASEKRAATELLAALKAMADG